MRTWAAFLLREAFLFGSAVAATQWLLAIVALPLASSLDARGDVYRLELARALFPSFRVLSTGLCLMGLAASTWIWFGRARPTGARVRRIAVLWALLFPALVYVNPKVALGILPVPGLVSYLALSPPAVPDPGTWEGFRKLRPGDPRERMLEQLGQPPVKAVRAFNERGPLDWVSYGETDATGWRWGVRALPDGTVAETFLFFWFD